jgi:uncharacterized protein (UPF0276 family)
LAPPGVGLTLQPELRPFLEARPDSVDYIELVPDTAWTDLGPGSRPRYVDDDEVTAWLDRLGLPVVLHSIGLSIGSAHRFDDEHVAQVARWQRRLDAAWHSDHLAWHLASPPGGELNVNLTMPVPLDRATLEMVVERVGRVQAAVAAPFLLENNVYYFDCGQTEVDEASFLAEVASRTGSGILLDLHNLWVNVRNRGWDVEAYLDRLDLRHVVEIHVAGGFELDGFLLDAHSGAAPAQVWAMAQDVVPRCPHLQGLTFELFGSWFEDLGPDALANQLDQARAALGVVRA